MQAPCTAKLAGHPPCKTWPAQMLETWNKVLAASLHRNSFLHIILNESKFWELHETDLDLLTHVSLICDFKFRFNETSWQFNVLELLGGGGGPSECVVLEPLLGPPIRSEFSFYSWNFLLQCIFDTDLKNYKKLTFIDSSQSVPLIVLR